MADEDEAVNGPGAPKAKGLGNMQNLLGFLLTGFGGILSFIGLRSTEITTVLRNDSLQAGLIALILLLSVLAAVMAVGAHDTDKIPLQKVAAIIIFLFGVGAMMIFMIPIDAPLLANYGIASLACSGAFGLIALCVWMTAPAVSESTGVAPRWRKRPIAVPVVFILASVILLACSAYGAMRLETDSQLSSSVQVAATIANNGSDYNLSVTVTGSKVKTDGYIAINVLGLPSQIEIASACGPVKVPKGAAICTDDPCIYLVRMCERVVSGNITPDASGDVNETLSDGIVPGLYQDIDVRAEVCSSVGCNVVSHSGSRLDFHLADIPVA